jgi:hypothetical protein
MPNDHDMFAYIDPAAGATIVQLVVAGTVGVGAVVKLKWSSIKSLFNRGEISGDETSRIDSVSDDSPEAPVDIDG